MHRTHSSAALALLIRRRGVRHPGYLLNRYNSASRFHFFVWESSSCTNFPNLNSMNDDGQIHAFMNSTVIMECAGRIEWADGCAIIAIEDQVYTRRAVFCFWLRGGANPGTISDTVWCCCYIIHER